MLRRNNGARFEGDSLVIETVDPEAGFLNTLSTPYPQSAQMRTEARFTADSDRLHVDILHTDPVIYREPFVSSSSASLEILEFGCTIEAASYGDCSPVEIRDNIRFFPDAAWHARR